MDREMSHLGVFLMFLRACRDISCCRRLVSSVFLTLYIDIICKERCSTGGHQGHSLLPVFIQRL